MTKEEAVKLKDLAQKLVRLLEEPELGLFSWNDLCRQLAAEIGEYGTKESRPDLDVRVMALEADQERANDLIELHRRRIQSLYEHLYKVERWTDMPDNRTWKLPD